MSLLAMDFALYFISYNPRLSDDQLRQTPGSDESLYFPNNLII